MIPPMLFGGSGKPNVYVLDRSLWPEYPNDQKEVR